MKSQFATQGKLKKNIAKGSQVVKTWNWNSEISEN
jgi:hypothetical protein